MAVHQLETVRSARLNVLGGFSLRFGERVVVLPGQAERVLGFLVVNGRGQRRDTLIGQLWGDLSQERAQACLRSALWRIRRVEPTLLDVSATTVRITERVAIDLEEAIAWAREVINQGKLPADPGALEAWQADLLPTWDDEWVVFERERVRQLRIHALEAVSRVMTRDGNFSGAIESACAAIAAEPLRDSAHAALIQAHLAESNRGEAMRAFERYAAIMHRELGLKPSRRIAALLRDELTA